MIKKLAAAFLLTVCATSAQAQDPTKQYNVIVSDHCDTFSVTLDETTGYIAAVRGGCNGTNILAGVQATTEAGNGAVFGENANDAAFIWFFTAPVNGQGTVYLYRSNDGVAERLAASAPYQIQHGAPKSHHDASSMLTSTR